MKTFEFHMTAPTEDGQEVDLFVTCNLIVAGSRFGWTRLFVSPLLNGKAYEMTDSDWESWNSEIEYQSSIEAEKAFDSYKTYRREAI